MVQFALWITSSTPTACEVLGSQSGADVLVVDGQHGAFGPDEGLALVTACTRTSAKCAVRVSDWRAEAEICRYIDAGAEYVICPMVNSQASCEEFCRHCFYPPTGTRSYGPYRHRLGGQPFSPTTANQRVVPLAMIETKLALGNLDEILQVESLGGVFIGPNDLGLSMGHAPTSAPEGEVLRAIHHVLARAQALGKRAGIFCTDAKTAKAMAGLGFDFVVFGTDLGLATAGAKLQLANCKL
ncbi:hypothetical protein BASA81_000261 [Batrachochytrium salamandrivorans]|nr:hypothetical protein BASA81_000261 [Batrachochytrium salamandrivorans]